MQLISLFSIISHSIPSENNNRAIFCFENGKSLDAMFRKSFFSFFESLQPDSELVCYKLPYTLFSYHQFSRVEFKICPLATDMINYSWKKIIKTELFC